jgi:hypothetical protein
MTQASPPILGFSGAKANVNAKMTANMLGNGLKDKMMSLICKPKL